MDSFELQTVAWLSRGAGHIALYLWGFSPFESWYPGELSLSFDVQQAQVSQDHRDAEANSSSSAC